MTANSSRATASIQLSRLSKDVGRTLLTLNLCFVPVVCLAEPAPSGLGGAMGGLAGNSQPAPPAISFMVKQFAVEGASPLSAEAIAAHLSPLGQKQYNLEQLQGVAKGLEMLIRDQGYPFYRVTLPPQTLNSGVVKLRVVSFALGKIDVTGNQYFSKDNIVRSLPGLKSGSSPNTVDLSEYLEVANKHPSKQVAVTFKESETEDKVDANINVSEQRPYQATAILNTVGTRGTGGFRITGALQHSNLWGLDHVANFSYTTSPDHADIVEQYGGSYSIPIYQTKGWFSTYYAYSNVNNGTVATDLNITGSGEMFGIHYLQLLPKIGDYKHWLDLGLDNRLFANSIQFSGNQPNGSKVRSLPIGLLYKAEFPWQSALIGYNVQWLSNTGIGTHNRRDAYGLDDFGSSTGKSQDWNLVRYGANMVLNFRQWQLQTTLIGQFSEDSLISGEQFGIGGTYDVRGYQERETSGDKGEVVKLELTTPTYEQFSLFAFYDYGHGHNNNAIPGQVKDWSLNSTGVGANWQWRQNISAKITYATALNDVSNFQDAQTTKSGDSRILATIVLRY